MIHFEGTIHQEETECSVKSERCDGVNVGVTIDQMDYDLNNRETYIAVCEGCEGYIADEI